MNRIAAAVSCWIALFCCSTLQAQVPQLINYQGRVVVGTTNFNGAGSFKFALVNAAGTSTYWSNDGSSSAGGQPTNSVSLTVANGLYSVLLGDNSLSNMTPIPASVFNNSDVRLRVWFNDGTHGSQQLSPDQRIAAVGYAVIAGNVPDGAITSAKIADGAVTNTQLASGAAALNLSASGQSGVASGGIVLAAAQDPALVAVGYVNIGQMTSVDGWQQRITTAPPAARISHSAVWTGSEMIIWGGAATSNFLNDGARFNPTLNSWSLLQATGAPTARRDHTTVWTGTEMIVFGGSASGPTYLNDIGRYSPVTDTWNPAAPIGTPPTVRTLATAVWSGTEMIVWGGNAGAATVRGDGARFNPTTNAWTAVGVTGGPPSARYSHTAVWTGTEMLIWGGNTGGIPTNTGGRYTPSSDSWVAMALTGTPPSARSLHTAIWTGSSMIVWGGSTGTYTSGMLGDGAAFTPGAGTAWTALPSANAPTGRAGHSAVWTGSEMIVWAGFAVPAAPQLVNDGARFKVANLTWTALNLSSPPPARYQHSAVWTGSEMIVFGGSGSTFPFGDTWTYSLPKTFIIYQRP